MNTENKDSVNDSNGDILQTISIKKNIDKTVQDIQINLRLLGDIKENEKLMVDDDRYLRVDNRPFQLFQRWWSEDSRSRTIEFIDRLIVATKEYCEHVVSKIETDYQNKENFEELLRFHGLLNSAIVGLSRLNVTYGSDKLSRAKIETILSKIRAFCDMDLKKAVGMNI